ncbi:porin family protein [Corallococcus sp. EGB]|uniref:porin family protein n=1 Tax=Corallococcus sp. EGB TaxID=1521117 RepID=UPI001CBF6214|nr:porin family protein [Corallococcus sp. EGB]
MTARHIIASLALTSFLGALPAAAQEPKKSGLALGVRGAIGIPVGDSFRDTSLRDTFGTTVAPQVDVSWFFSRQLSLGGYFQYGIGSGPHDSCSGENNPSCTSTVLRVGVDLDYHFLPDGFIGPWVGVGVGYEIGKLEAGRGASNTWLKLEGYDLAHAHLGLDLHLTRSIAVGPYISASVGQYSEGAVRLGDVETSDNLTSDEKRIHVWVQPGVRVQFRL